MKNPIRTTIAFALISGIVVVPLALLLDFYLPLSTAFKLALWADLTIYAVLMVRWSGSRLMPALFPSALLLGVALWPSTDSGFYILSLGVFAWIRSGICFKDAPPVRTLTAEALTIVGGALLMVFFGAQTSVSWALNICFFFLVQSLFFFLVPQRGFLRKTRVSKDLFEQAAEDANKILDGI